MVYTQQIKFYCSEVVHFFIFQLYVNVALFSFCNIGGLHYRRIEFYCFVKYLPAQIFFAYKVPFPFATVWQTTLPSSSQALSGHLLQVQPLEGGLPDCLRAPPGGPPEAVHLRQGPVRAEPRGPAGAARARGLRRYLRHPELGRKEKGQVKMQCHTLMNGRTFPCTVAFYGRFWPLFG